MTQDAPPNLVCGVVTEALIVLISDNSLILFTKHSLFSAGITFTVRSKGTACSPPDPKLNNMTPVMFAHVLILIIISLEIKFVSRFCVSKNSAF